MNHTEFVKSLRDLADFYEARPLLPVPYLLDNVNVFLDNKEELATVARQLGTATKAFDANYFTLEKMVNPSLKLQFNVSRGLVCERVATGKTRTVPAYSSPERVEEVFEWKCVDPLLA